VSLPRRLKDQHLSPSKRSSCATASGEGQRALFRPAARRPPGEGHRALATSTYARIRPMDRSAGSELLSMMGLVAAVVAIVILFFFGVGYLFGRLFL
jgi:hypothetical protein